MQTTSPFEMEQQNVDILLLTSVRVRACVRPIRCCAAVQTAKCTTDSALSHSLKKCKIGSLGGCMSWRANNMRSGYWLTERKIQALEKEIIHPIFTSQ